MMTAGSSQQNMTIFSNLGNKNTKKVYGPFKESDIWWSRSTVIKVHGDQRSVVNCIKLCNETETEKF